MDTRTPEAKGSAARTQNAESGQGQRMRPAMHPALAKGELPMGRMPLLFTTAQPLLARACLKSNRSPVCCGRAKTFS